jgi:putative hemolysin
MIEVTTVSGLMTELSRIPKQGEKLIWQKIWLIIMDGVKIDKVMVKALQ